MNKKILFASLLGLILFTLVYTYFNTFTCKQITHIDDIPIEILNELNEIKLERGVYLFTRNFTKNGEVYFAVCGGSSFSDKYNVKIKNIKTEEYFKTTNIYLEELENKAVPAYNSNSNTPYILFKVINAIKISNIHLTEDLVFKIDDTTLPINQWWGENKTAGEVKGYSYKFVESENEIDPKIWEAIQKLEFRDEKWCYVFSPYARQPTPQNLIGDICSFDIDDLYVVIHSGDKDLSSYSIAIENFYPNLHERSKSISFNFSYHEVECSDNKFNYPFAVLKISSEKLKDRINRYPGVSYPAIINVWGVDFITKSATNHSIYAQHIVNPEYCEDETLKNK